MRKEYLELLEEAIFKRFGKRVNVKYDEKQYYVAQKDDCKFGLGFFLSTAHRFIQVVMTEEDMELLKTNENI